MSTAGAALPEARDNEADSLLLPSRRVFCMRQSKRQKPAKPSLSASADSQAVEGLFFPQQEQTLPQWLQQLKVRWRLTRQQTKDGLCTLPYKRTSAEAIAKAETAASIRDGCAVASQLGYAARSDLSTKRKSTTRIDWKTRVGMNTDRGHRSALEAPAWTEEMRQVQHLQPRGLMETSVGLQTHMTHLLNRYANSHPEKDGFLHNRISSADRQIQQLVQALSTGIDALELLCQEPFVGTPEEIQARSELAARLGLLVHMSIQEQPLDNQEHRALDAAGPSKNQPPAESGVADEGDNDSDCQPSSALMGVVEMSSWDGAGVEGWQVITVTDGSKKPKQTYFSPTGVQFSSVALAKRHLSDSSAGVIPVDRSDNHGPRDRVCSECKPKHRTVETCRKGYGHTGPNWNWRK